MKHEEFMIGDWFLNPKGEVVQCRKNLYSKPNKYWEYSNGIDLSYQFFKDNGFVGDREEMTKEDLDLTIKVRPWLNSQSAFLFSVEITDANGILAHLIHVSTVHQFQQLLRACGLVDIANEIQVNRIDLQPLN